ncbi:MAG TPA: hypothetical protein VMW49_06875, partial [Candidatus Dormibacteraeota bacterium]|nr:hypothetical protein [Candidatus Dormibacteraeota bacterium]
MSRREERRLAQALMGWLEGTGTPSDATDRAIANTAVLIVEALAPQPLGASTRARLYERALQDHRAPVHGPAPAVGLAEVRRMARQVPGPAWVGLGSAAAAAGVVLGMALLRGR